MRSSFSYLALFSPHKLVLLSSDSDWPHCLCNSKYQHRTKNQFLTSKLNRVESSLYLNLWIITFVIIQHCLQASAWKINNIMTRLMCQFFLTMGALWMHVIRRCWHHLHYCFWYVLNKALLYRLVFLTKKKKKKIIAYRHTWPLISSSKTCNIDLHFKSWADCVHLLSEISEFLLSHNTEHIPYDRKQSPSQICYWVDMYLIIVIETA